MREHGPSVCHAASDPTRTPVARIRADCVRRDPTLRPLRPRRARAVTLAPSRLISVPIRRRPACHARVIRRH